MSAGYLSNLLIKNQEVFVAEYKEVYTEGLASSPWQHFDQTGARVGGVNHTTNVSIRSINRGSGKKKKWIDAHSVVEYIR